MGLKDLLFISDENDKNKKEEATKSSIKFPTTQENVNTQPSTNFGSLFNVFGGNTTASTPTVTTNQPLPEHLNKAIELYQQGFDSLNQNGYDFYEFYQTVIHGGVENPQVYSMAYAMGTAMDKTISKEKLVQQSGFYLSEINKVYTDYVNKGTQKKQELVAQKSNENQSLINELDLIRQQMEALQAQLHDRENKLNAIGSKYEPMLIDVESKLNANEIAKNKIVQQIEQVKNGIINNLK